MTNEEMLHVEIEKLKADNQYLRTVLIDALDMLTDGDAGSQNWPEAPYNFIYRAIHGVRL